MCIRKSRQQQMVRDRQNSACNAEQCIAAGNTIPAPRALSDAGFVAGASMQWDANGASAGQSIQAQSTVRKAQALQHAPAQLWQCQLGGE
jgi:hypothetical protein